MTAREKLYQAMTPVVVLELLDEIQSERDHITRLQVALAFWMPSIAGEDSPDGARAAQDAMLLYGLDKDEEPDRYGNRARDQLATVLADKVFLTIGHEELRRDAERYRWLRSRDPGPAMSLTPAGVFIGQVPENWILSEEDADAAIDDARTQGDGS